MVSSFAPRSAALLAGLLLVVTLLVPAGPAWSSHSGPHASINSVSTTEGDDGPKQLTFTISVDQAPTLLDGEWIVAWETREVTGGATDGSDFVGDSGTVAFEFALMGDTTQQQVPITVNGDTEIEPHEVFEVHLVAEGTSPEVGFTNPVGTGTILNDDTSVAISDAQVREGDGGTTTMSFTVELAAASALEVTVDHATADGTATAGEDYEQTNGTVTFPPGITLRTIPVTIIADTTEEPDETFSFVLSNPGDATITRDTGVGTIIDDDAPPTIEVSGGDRSVETGVVHTFEATTTGPDGVPLTVRWNFGDGSLLEIGNPVSYAFDRVGVWDVVATVDDGKGGKDTATFTVTATDTGVISRVSGLDRILTAVAASRAHWPSATSQASGHSGPAATHALIALADKYPDALAAGPLSAKLDAPLLLSDQASMPAAVEEELARLGLDTVWLLGGPNSLSTAIEQRLTDLGYEVARRSGDSRFDTAATIAREVGANSTGEVVVTLGEDAEPSRAFPDALSSGSLSASPEQMPVLLTRTDDLPAVTEQALADLETKKVWIVGGTASVSSAVEARMKALGYDVERLAGAGRYETSVAVAQLALARAADGPVRLVFATGENFPDGLAGGAIAGRVDGLLVLVPNGDLPTATSQFLAAEADRFDLGVILGGSNTLSETVRFALAQLMKQ